MRVPCFFIIKRDMDLKIEYPYMPEGRHLKYVPHDHEFMRAASEAREELAGDPIWPVGIVAVRDGKVVARAGNGFNRGSQQKHVCPRIVRESKSGEDYELCDVHDPPGHSEPQLVKAMQAAGVETEGADAYMYGHWWACEPCWKALIDAGFRDLYVTEDAHERFAKEKVYGETLTPTYTKLFTEQADARDREKMLAECGELGCELVEELSDDTVRVVRVADGFDVYDPEGRLAYEIRTEEPDREYRMLKQVLRSL